MELVGKAMKPSINPSIALTELITTYGMAAVRTKASESNDNWMNKQYGVTPRYISHEAESSKGAYFSDTYKVIE